MKWLPLDRTTMLALSLALLASSESGVCSVMIVSPGESIQRAIDISHPGDVILVYSDIYQERLRINKSLTVMGVGEEMPVIDCQGMGNAITLLADGITLKGFEVINSTVIWPSAAGILVLSNDNYVEGNYLMDNHKGIILSHCTNNTITRNVVINCDEGINGLDCTNNHIYNNRIIMCEDDGINLDHSENNTVKGNEILDSGDDGLLLISASNNNTVEGNTISQTEWHGLELFYSHNNILRDNDISNSSICNLLLRGSDDNIVANNNITNSSLEGVDLTFSSFNNISGNRIFGNARAGLLMERSFNNTVDSNIIEKSGQVGIYLNSECLNNHLWENALSDNGLFEAYDSGNNIWDNNGKGNYYSTYDEPSEGCKDIDSNGICDRKYSPDGNMMDEYPLANYSFITYLFLDMHTPITRKDS